jgi:hypothetical protein
MKFIVSPQKRTWPALTVYGSNSRITLTPVQLIWINSKWPCSCTLSFGFNLLLECVTQGETYA